MGFDASISHTNKWALKVSQAASLMAGKKAFSTFCGFGFFPCSNDDGKIGGGGVGSVERGNDRNLYTETYGDRCAQCQNNRLHTLNGLCVCVSVCRAIHSVAIIPFRESFICTYNLWLFIFDFINCFRALSSHKLKQGEREWAPKRCVCLCDSRGNVLNSIGSNMINPYRQAVAQWLVDSEWSNECTSMQKTQHDIVMPHWLWQ